MQGTHMTGFDAEKLRAQIMDNQIEVDALSYDTAYALFVYEIDRTELDTCDEPTILDALLQRLDGTDTFDHAREVVPTERYTELVRQATAVQTVRRMPLFKKIILIAAAVILLSSLGLTVYASYLGPFEGFVDNIKDLLGIEVGEVLVNGNEELMMDNSAEFYDDFESLLQQHQLELLYPTNFQTTGKDSITLYWAGESYCLSAKYPIGFLRIYIKNPPYNEEDVLNDLPQTPKYIINGFKYYSIPGNDYLQYAMFYNEQLYVIHTKNHADFLTIAEHMEKPS